MVAVALLQSVFSLAAGGDHSTNLIGDLDLRDLTGGKFVLDFQRNDLRFGVFSETEIRGATQFSRMGCAA